MNKRFEACPIESAQDNPLPSCSTATLNRVFCPLVDFLLRLGRKPRNVLWSTRSFLLSKIFFPNSPFFFFNRWKTSLFHSRLNIFPVSYSPSSFFFLPLLSTLSIDRDVKLNVWFGYNCNNLFSPDGQNICFARLFDCKYGGGTPREKRRGKFIHDLFQWSGM